MKIGSIWDIYLELEAVTEDQVFFNQGLPICFTGFHNLANLTFRDHPISFAVVD